MSYILDALKKSEQERSRGRAPDLHALHETSLTAATEKSRGPYWFGLAVVVLAAIALSVWLQPWESKVSPAVIITPPQAAQVPRPVVAPPSMFSMTPTPAVPSSPPAAPLTAPAPQTPPAQENRVIAYSELPLEVRRGIPEMSFAVHLYSPKPAERMVSINGKMMQENQEVSPGLKLLEIAQDGMVFSYQGYRFKRGVF